MAIASADPSFDVSDLIEMEEMASANNSGENVPKDKDVIDHEDTSNDSVNFKEIKRRNW